MWLQFVESLAAQPMPFVTHTRVEIDQIVTLQQARLIEADVLDAALPGIDGTAPVRCITPGGRSAIALFQLPR